jgi:predicted nucleotidyltransferase
VSYLPKDFIETFEGLIFAVVDGVLEDGCVLAFLRYAPEGAVHRKVSTEQANALLRADYPQYLHHSARLDADLHVVPLADIRRHHRPRERVRSLLARGPTDAIEAKLLRLLEKLMEGGMAPEWLGITGSLLIGRQTPASDLDVVAYGRAQFFRAKEAVSRLIACGELQDLDAPSWRDAYERRGCVLSFEEFLRHERRKGNKGMIEGTKFDLTMVDEAPDPEPVRWRKIGRATIRARVLDDSHTFDQPARYRLDHPHLSEVVSFTHTYVGQARAGERIEACGAVEESAAGFKRLVVGSSREAPGEYVRVLWNE